jgi:hypothetical protein
MVNSLNNRDANAVKCGSGLLAKVVCQSMHAELLRRILEQARSRI